jgi:hypothetical protein
MFRVLSVRWVWLVALIGYQSYLAFVASPPLSFNPLFFVVDDATTVWLARVTFWYLLLPAHLLEAVAAMWIAFGAGKHSVLDVLLWGLQTAVMGFPSIQLLLRVNRGGPRTAAAKKR